MMIRTLKS